MPPRECSVVFLKLGTVCTSRLDDVSVTVTGNCAVNEICTYITLWATWFSPSPVGGE